MLVKRLFLRQKKVFVIPKYDINLFNEHLLKWAKPGLFLFTFILFSHRKDKYSTNLTINEKNIDGVHGSQTQGDNMEGGDESTELWRHPFNIHLRRHVEIVLTIPFCCFA